jgi:hypothetical protein
VSGLLFTISRHSFVHVLVHEPLSAGDAIAAFSGSVVAYIGELGPHVVKAKRGFRNTFPPGGSSSSAAFQTTLASNFELVQTVFLPNWPPYNSHLTIWKKRASASHQRCQSAQPVVKRQRSCSSQRTAEARRFDQDGKVQ